MQLIHLPRGKRLGRKSSWEMGDGNSSYAQISICLRRGESQVGAGKEAVRGGKSRMKHAQSWWHGSSRVEAAGLPAQGRRFEQSP